MKKILLSLVILNFCWMLFSQQADVVLPSKMPRETLNHYKAFSYSYNTSYALPTWITYKVTQANVDKGASVKAKYKEDPNIAIRAANKKDYKDGGYLMAQLVSYLDVMHIDKASDESFYMTNIVPMKMAFRKHIWLKSADLIRLWVKNGEGLYIMTGPVIKADAPFPTMGANKISIPNRYYKVVYDAKNKKAVGFVFKNGTSSGSMKSFSKSIDEIEELTGIDFMPELDEETAKEVESKIDFEFWNFELEEELQ